MRLSDKDKALAISLFGIIMMAINGQVANMSVSNVGFLLVIVGIILWLAGSK